MALKKYIHKDIRGNISGYYIGYVSVYSKVVSDTESKAIRNAMKDIGGADWISEVRFRLDCKRFTKDNAFYENTIGEIDNRFDKPIYKVFLGNSVVRTYQLSKDGKKIRQIKG